VTWDSNPGSDISVVPKIFRPALVHIEHIKYERLFFSGVKQLESEVSHSSPSTVEVRNECRYASAHPILLLGGEH
jgi:hypothetical protein